MSTVSLSFSFSATPIVTVGVVQDPLGELEAAIATWARVGSGLPASQIVWVREGYTPDPIPVGTYIALRLKGFDAVSDDWLISRRVGDQVVHHVRGTRHPKLQITCVAGAPYGSGRAQMILTRIASSLVLPSVAQVLRRAKVGVGTFGTTSIIDGRRSGMFDPRAVIEVDLGIGIDIAETGGEFRSADVTTPLAGTTHVTKP